MNIGNIHVNHLFRGLLPSDLSIKFPFSLNKYTHDKKKCISWASPDSGDLFEVLGIYHLAQMVVLI